MDNLQDRFEKAKAFFKGRDLIILDNTYIKAKSKLSCIDSLGYKYLTTYDCLKATRNKPDIVSKWNPYTIENIKLWLKINKPQYILLSTIYVNNHDLLNFECKMHGKFKMCWGNISQGQHCPKCGDDIKNSKQYKLNIRDVKVNVITKIPTISVISEKWVSSSHKLKCQCTICNNKFDALYFNLLKGEGCPACGIRKGKNSGQWKGGITPLQNHLRTLILPWRIDSFKFYDNTCCITGVKAKENLIHHKHGFNKIVEETMQSLNLPIYQEINKYTEVELRLIEDTCLSLHYKYGLGVCVCRDIHNKFHSIYGRGNNTEEQWNEFIKIINKTKEIKYE
jgi:hypothetical protein